MYSLLGCRILIGVPEYNMICEGRAWDLTCCVSSIVQHVLAALIDHA